MPNLHVEVVGHPDEFPPDPARAIALKTNRPEENVHIIVEPAARGRIAFGGKLVE